MSKWNDLVILINIRLAIANLMCERVEKKVYKNIIKIVRLLEKEVGDSDLRFEELKNKLHSLRRSQISSISFASYKKQEVYEELLKLMLDLDVKNIQSRKGGK